MKTRSVKLKKRKITKNLSLPLLEELQNIDKNLFNEQILWNTPEYIIANLKHTLRYYQNEALRYYHYSQTNNEFKHRNVNHVLFNMATGSGKTDVMASLILYHYQELGYQNFLFIVNQNGVLNKTIDNLTKPTSEKYLFANKIEIMGSTIEIKKVETFPQFPQRNTIYLKLDTVQQIASDIYTQKENSIETEKYSKNKIVILGDEAHHYSASTAKEKNTEQSWEKAIDIILKLNEKNRLLEFTATINLEKTKIYEKYQHKILYRYELDSFINDKFSKNVKRIQSSNKDIDNMLNAVLLSEFRRRYALEEYGVYLKPIIMFKSQRIEASDTANKKFVSLIEDLSSEMLKQFLNRQKHIIIKNNNETLNLAYNYYEKKLNIINEIIHDIKREFSSNRIINANDTDRSNILEKGSYDELNTLESPLNLRRVVFAVAKLTEGWDVLNLYDIVRLSDDVETSNSKPATLAEAQLIGRGARYNPLSIENKTTYKRRFEDGSNDSLILETIHYHTINEPQYLKNLISSLIEMNLPTGEDKKNPLLEIKLKNSFKKTEVYRNGKIFYNETIEVNDTYYDSLTKYGIDNKKDIIIPYISTMKETGYKDIEIKENTSELYNVAIEIDDRYLTKVMNRLSFYHFNNLKNYIPLLKTRKEFFGENWLNIKRRTIYVSLPRTMDAQSLTPNEKLIIIEKYFFDLSLKIKNGYSKRLGTSKFIGYPISEYVINYRKRVPNYDTSKLDLGKASQIVKRYEIKDEYFVYDSAIVNITERQLIDRIIERIPELKKSYDDVYLIRMDENMHRESIKNNQIKLHQFGKGHKEIHLEGFQPDFILFLKNENYSIQIFIEPKGRNIIEEQWKEDLLLYINLHEHEIVFEEDLTDFKIKGVKFYTLNDDRSTIEQIGKITLGKDFKGLSL